MKTHDRAAWPAPADNPLVLLLQRPDEWISNTELAEALEFTPQSRSKAVVGHYKDLDEELGKGETMLQKRIDPKGQPRLVRLYSKKAMVLICMRARTRNAAAFRDWLAARIVAQGADAAA